MKDLAVVCFVGAILFSGAPPIAVGLSMLAVLLVVLAKWP